MSRPTLALIALSLAVPSVALAIPCPNIMLVLDQSYSMSQDPDGNDPPNGPSKWQLLQDVVINVVKQYGDHVPFGLELFSTDAWKDDYKCYDSTAITVELSHAAGGDIISKLKAAMPSAETNTGEAIKRAYLDMSLTNDPKKKAYIILVTDGDPNCHKGDWQTGTADYTVSEIQNAAAKGIKTYVIGFDGKGIKPTNLDNMAFYGKTATHVNCGSQAMPPDPCYYRAGTNAQDFQAVFDKIVRDAGGGEFGGQICDDSCYALGCPKGQVCITEETNPEPHCINDPCGGKTCSGDTFCRGGGCVGTCKNGCSSTQKCENGNCVADKCAGKNCPNAGDVCNPTDGTCIPFPCPNCTTGAICDVASGKCVADQCKIITCPSGTQCVNNGNCSASNGGGGCDTAPKAGGIDQNALGALALLLFASLMMLRRRTA